MNEPSALTQFTLHLLLLSFLAIGGINPVLPELHRFVVLENNLLTNETFIALFALAQTAPGPNVIFVTLIGWQVYGLVGALVSTLAICGPATVIAYAAAGLSDRWQHRRWFIIIRRGLVPITTGLMIASAFLLCVTTGISWASYVITAVVALFVLTTRINPLWLLATAGLAGVFGLV